MKLRAKKGTELERVLLEMNDRMLRENAEALCMIEEYCGARPKAIGYGCVFGYTAIWNWRVLEFDEDIEIPAQLVRSAEYPGYRVLYKVSRRSKAGRDFVEAWEEKFRGIDGSVLAKFGIPVISRDGRRYCYWLPRLDERGAYVQVGSHLLDRMEISGESQFTIETNGEL